MNAFGNTWVESLATTLHSSNPAMKFQLHIVLRSGVRLWDIIVQDDFADVQTDVDMDVHAMSVDMSDGQRVMEHCHVPSAATCRVCRVRISTAAMPWCSRHLRAAKSRADTQRPAAKGRDILGTMISKYVVTMFSMFSSVLVVCH